MAVSVSVSAEVAPSRRTSLIRSGLGLGFAAWLGYYVISGEPYLSVRVFRPTVAFQAVTAAVIVGYILYLSFRRRLPRQTFLDWPVFALLIAYGAATAASVNWRVSLESTLQVLPVVLVFYISGEEGLLDVKQVRRALLLVMSAAAAYALFEVGRDYLDWLRLSRAVDPSWGLSDLLPPTVPRVHDVGDHPNMLAMSLVLAVPFCVVGLLEGRRVLPRLASAGALVLIAGALFFTLSRAGWIGAAVAAALAAAGWVVVCRPHLLRAPRLHVSRSGVRLALYAATLVVVAGVLGAALIVATRWESRPEWLFRGSLSPRLDAMAAGGEMFRDRPLLGTGPGTYGLMYTQYSGAYPIQAVHAHNGFLQAVDDLGVAGVGVMVVVVVAAAGALWGGYRRASPEARLLLLTCGAAVAGFLVHSLADAPNASKTALTPLAVVLALMVRATPEPPSGEDRGEAQDRAEALSLRSPDLVTLSEAKSPDSSSAAGGLRMTDQAGDAPRERSAAVWRRRLLLLPSVTVLAALVAVLFFWGRLDGPHRHYSQGLEDADAGRWTEAIPDFQRAVDGDPDLAVYQLELGLSETMAYVGGAPRPLLDQGIAHLERAVDLEPRGAIGHANLARAYLLAGRLTEARDSALEAIRRAGHDSVVVIAAASVVEEAGTAQEAREAYATALALDASMAFSPFWSGSDFRTQNYQEIVASSILSLNPCLVGQQLPSVPAASSLDLGNAAQDCRLFLLGRPGDVAGRVDLATILMATGQSQEALAILEDAVARHPDDGAVRRALGQWYLQAGDLERARHEWLLGAQLDDPRAAMMLGDSYAPGPVPDEVVRRAQAILYSGDTNLNVGGVQLYLLGILYYRMKFHRESPTTILVPGDWEEALGGPYAALSQALGRWRRG